MGARARATNAAYRPVTIRRGFISVVSLKLEWIHCWPVPRAKSYRANPQRFGKRQKWIAAGGYELVRDVALVVKIRDGGGDGVIVQFLAVVDLMPSGDTAGMKMSDPVDVVADRSDDIALHDLHMINVVQQFQPRRIDATHHRNAKGGVITLIPRMIDFAVEQFHADGDAMFFGDRRNLRS